MAIQDILLLGDQRLYEKCEPIRREEIPELRAVVDLMAQTILDFRTRYGAGRAIAAPQIGVMKRLVVMNINEPIAFYNPVLYDFSEEIMELWDDCMSFPNLLVKLRRHRRCKMKFHDANWREQLWELEGDLSELLQHECDHLDGILATMRALDDQSFKIGNRKPEIGH